MSEKSIGCPKNFNNCLTEQQNACPNDPKVCMAQQWIIDNFPNAGMGQITGKTGWPSIYALIRATQEVLGIPASEQSDTFGVTSQSNFTKQYGVIQYGSSGQIIGIIQCALWLKGYSGGNWSKIDTKFDYAMSLSVNELRKDAGLDAIRTADIDLTVMKGLLSMDQYKLVVGGMVESDPVIREAQQFINRTYLKYTGLMPCDGIYARNTNRALIKALQAEEKFLVEDATGVFGNETKKRLPSINMQNANGISNLGVDHTRCIKLFKFALYANNYKVAINNVYDNDLMQTIIQYQSFMKLSANGLIDVPTWCSVLISCGDRDRKGDAFDTSVILTPAQIQTLSENKYKFAGRYLSGTVAAGKGPNGEQLTRSKAMEFKEIRELKKQGFLIYPIFQQGGRKLDQYTPTMGKTHAYTAFVRATHYGIMEGETIYFAVDLDAQGHEIVSNIVPYFKAIKDTLESLPVKYKVGIYGTRNVCNKVIEDNKLAEKAFVSDMSYGWSGNLGFPMPKQWAFDQIKEGYVGGGDGNVNIDNNIASERATGFKITKELVSTLDWNLTKPFTIQTGNKVLVYENNILDSEVYLKNVTLNPKNIKHQWRIRESFYRPGEYIIAPAENYNGNLPICLTIDVNAISGKHKITLQYHNKLNASRQVVRFFDYHNNTRVDGEKSLLSIGMTYDYETSDKPFSQRLLLETKDTEGIQFALEGGVEKAKGSATVWTIKGVNIVIPEEPKQVYEIKEGHYYTLRMGNLYMGVPDSVNITSPSLVALMKDDGTNAIVWEGYKYEDSNFPTITALKSAMVSTKALNGKEPDYNRILSNEPNLIPPEDPSARQKFAVTHQPVKKSQGYGGLGGAVPVDSNRRLNNSNVEIYIDLQGIEYYISCDTNKVGAEVGLFTKDNQPGAWVPTGNYTEWVINEVSRRKDGEEPIEPDPDPWDGTVESGTLYNIENIKSSDYLNFYSSGTIVDGTKLCTYEPDGSNEQKFWFQHDKLYSYTHNKYCVDMHYSTKAAQAWSAAISEDSNQQIDILQKSGFVLIKLKNKDLYLTKSSTSSSVTWASNSNNEYARWKLIKLNHVSNGIERNNNSTTLGTVLAKISNKAYSNRFDRGECTWYCQGRALEKVGKLPMFSADTGLHGTAWYDYMKGTRHKTVPRTNSIASYSGPNGFGHVVFVEQVVNDQVYFTEYNFNQNENGQVQVRTIAEMKNRGENDSFTLNGYIYL